MAMLENVTSDQRCLRGTCLHSMLVQSTHSHLGSCRVRRRVATAAVSVTTSARTTFFCYVHYSLYNYDLDTN